MSSEDAETTVNESYSVTVPAEVRDAVDLQPGDRLRWTVSGDGRLVAEVVRERHGRASELDAVDMGETDAVEVTEGYEWS
jgi:antitoxin PrlF